jgi:hypothetical protein
MPVLNLFSSASLRSIVAALIAAACGPAAQSQASNSVANKNQAAMPEYIQGFFLSEAVRSQDRGEVQLTFAADSRQRVGTNVSMQIEYGLTDRLQIGLDIPYGFTAEQNAETPVRWSSTSVGLLYQIIRSDRPFALSAGMMLQIPVRAEGKPTYQPTILLAKTFRKFQIHASFLSEVEQWRPSLEYNLASVYPIRRCWFPTFEFNERRQNARNALYLTPGLYRHFRHSLEVGIGIPLGIRGVAGSLGVVAKTNWEVGGSVEQLFTDQQSH